MRTLCKIFCVVCVLLLTACSTSPPSNVDNICSIFREKKDWYKAAKRTRDRWGMPVHVQLAIVHQESRFKYDAKPERTKILWIIPGPRKSSAYGYAQVLDETWDWYIKSTGNSGADRDDFDDALDFIGWYGNVTARKLGVSKWDAKNQYLAYHEGHGGFKRKTYLKKDWLVKVGQKVDRRSRQYASQYNGCKDSLDRGWFSWLPFV